MKKVFTKLFIITICFIVVGCNSKKEPESYEIKNVSTNNWRSVIKENFKLDISLPKTWTLQKAYSLNGVSNVKLIIVPATDTTYEEFGRTLFESSVIASTAQAIEVSSFSETCSTTDTCKWQYYPTSQATYVQINYYNNNANIELIFQK